MKFFINILNVINRAYARYLDRKIYVSIELQGINVQETLLKQKLTEGEFSFQTEHLRNCKELKWKTETLPLLKSNLYISAEFHLNLFESWKFTILPNKLIELKKSFLKEKIQEFLSINPYHLKRPSNKKSLFYYFFEMPRSIHIKSVCYQTLKLSPNNSFNLDDPSILPLFYDGQIDCFFKLYRLSKISYLIRSRIFYQPEPFIGEIYVRVKDRYNNGSYGKSFYKFQGRFLAKKSSNYLLSYWNLKPIWNEELLSLIPTEIFQLIPTETKEPILIKNLSRNQLSSLSVSRIHELMKSDDQASTS
jgi:hypothetical protein